MQIPIRPQRVQEDFLQEHAPTQLIHPFAHGQPMRHRHIARLHAKIRHEYPPHLPPQLPPSFPGIGQVARQEQEPRHVERIDHLLGVRVTLFYIHQVEGHHQDNEDAAQEIYFRQTVLHRQKPNKRSYFHFNKNCWNDKSS